MDDFYAQLQADPAWQTGLALLSGRPMQQGMDAAYNGGVLYEEAQARAQQEATRKAMASIDLENMPPQLKELFRVNPSLAIKMAQSMQKQIPQGQSTVGKIRADLEAGLIDPQTAEMAIQRAIMPKLSVGTNPQTGDFYRDNGDGTVSIIQPGGGVVESRDLPAPDYYSSDVQAAGLPDIPQNIPDTNGRYDVIPPPPEMNTPVLKAEWMKGEANRIAKLRESDATRDSTKEVEQSKKAEQAAGMIDLVKRAEVLLPGASSGLGENLLGQGQNLFGTSTEKTQTDKQLRVISAGLVANVPRMEGPQSNYDVQLYREAAGDIGNANIPYQDRLAALETIKAIQSKYAALNGFNDIQGNGDAVGDETVDDLAPDEIEFLKSQGLM